MYIIMCIQAKVIAIPYDCSVVTTGVRLLLNQIYHSFRDTRVRFAMSGQTNFCKYNERFSVLFPLLCSRAQRG